MKQNDLLVFYEARKGVKPEERDLWEFLGLRAKPFENVRYLLPWRKGTRTTGVLNCFGDLPHQFQTYRLAEPHDEIERAKKAIDVIAVNDRGNRRLSYFQKAFRLDLPEDELPAGLSM